MDLELELKKERERYVSVETAIRHLVKLPGGIPIVPSEREIKTHLDACRDFYNIYGSKFGYNSPWIEAFNDENHFSNEQRKN